MVSCLAQCSLCVPCPHLAVRAKVGAAPPDDDAANRASATATRLVRSLVNLQLLPKSAHLPFSIAVVAETGALKSHSAIEDFLHGPMQAAGGEQRDSPGEGQRMNLRGK